MITFKNTNTGNYKDIIVDFNFINDIANFSLYYLDNKGSSQLMHDNDIITLSRSSIVIGIVFEGVSSEYNNYFNATVDNTITLPLKYLLNKLYPVKTLNDNSFAEIVFKNSTRNIEVKQIQNIPSLPSFIHIVNNLTNCTSDKTTLSPNVSETITLTADSGYQFNNTPYIVVDGDTMYFDVSKDKLTATYTDTFSSGADVEVTATAEQIPVTTITIKNNLTNCTSDKTTLSPNVSETITLTADSGYQFNNTPYIVVDGDTMYFDVSTDKLTATYTDTFSSGADVEVTATAEQTKNTLTIKANLNNFTLTSGDLTITEGVPFELVFTCNNNYLFSGEIPTIDGRINGDMYSLDGILSADNKIVTFKDTIPNFDKTSELTLNATAIYNNPSTSNGVYTIYKVTSDNLTDISHKRFYVRQSEYYFNDYDIGRYINTIKKMFFNIPSDINQNIILGGKDTNISVPIIENNIITLTTDNIDLYGYYKDYKDINISEILLQLPFIGIQTINSQNINNTINIEYKINIITGDFIATVFNVTKNIIISTYTGNCSIDVPYSQLLTNNRDFQNIGSNETLFMKPIKAIIKYKKYFEHSLISNKQYRIIDTFAGELTGKIILNNIKATKNEIELIENIFETGVIC